VGRCLPQKFWGRQVVRFFREVYINGYGVGLVHVLIVRYLPTSSLTSSASGVLCQDKFLRPLAKTQEVKLG
jgi:hypothetical protein